MFVCDSQSKVVKKLLFSSSVWPRSFPLHNLLCSWGFRCFLSHHYLLLMAPAITAIAPGWVPCVRLCRASLVLGFFWPSADMITRCNLGEFFPSVNGSKGKWGNVPAILPMNGRSASEGQVCLVNEYTDAVSEMWEVCWSMQFVSQLMTY